MKKFLLGFIGRFGLSAFVILAAAVFVSWLGWNSKPEQLSQEYPPGVDIIFEPSEPGDLSTR